MTKTIQKTTKDIQAIKDIKRRIQRAFDDYTAYTNDAINTVIKFTNKPYFNNKTTQEKRDVIKEAMDEYAIGRSTSISELKDELKIIHSKYDCIHLQMLDQDYYYQLISPASSENPNYINITEPDLRQNILAKLQDTLIDDEDSELMLNYLVIDCVFLPFDDIIYPILCDAYAKDDITVVRALDPKALHKATHLML